MGKQIAEHYREERCCYEYHEGYLPGMKPRSMKRQVSQGPKDCVRITLTKGMYWAKPDSMPNDMMTPERQPGRIVREAVSSYKDWERDGWEAGWSAWAKKQTSFDASHPYQRLVEERAARGFWTGPPDWQSDDFGDYLPEARDQQEYKAKKLDRWSDDDSDDGGWGFIAEARAEKEAALQADAPATPAPAAPTLLDLSQ